MRIIGIGHYSRVGKDTFANYLVDCLAEYQPGLKVLKRSFAWKLKQITHELFGWAGLREPEYYETNGAARQVKLPALEMTPVEIWVAFGSKAVREQVYAQTWVDYLLKGTGCDVLIVPDVRFPNEVAAIREAGGTLVKVVRPGYGPLDTVADKALMGFKDWDYVIGDEGTMASLEQWASRFARAIATKAAVSQTAAAKQRALEVECLP